MLRNFATSYPTVSRSGVVLRGSKWPGKPLASLSPFSWTALTTPSRSYSPNDNYNSDGSRGMSPFPPPPPPPRVVAGQMMGAAPMYYAGTPYPAPMMPYYPSAAPAAASRQHEIGTAERPVVVVSAPQKPTWTSRLWMFLLISLIFSFIIGLIDDISNRFFPQDMPKQGGPGQGGAMNLFKSHEVAPVNLSELKVSFESIRGCDEAKKELEEVVEFLKDPEKFYEIGGQLPKGALLVGPPGCGKTLLAKAIAKEAGVNFYYATGSEFDEMYVGVGARRVRELFAAAKANAPALIFIDEIDALGGRRSHSDQAYSRMTLNQLLAEMDGFNSKSNVIVLAATNTPEALDKALTRPGRLDTTIAVDPPDMKGRAEIVQVYLDKIKTDNTVNAMDIARGTTGFTGAELSNLVNMAAIRAAVLNKKKVGREEVEYAKDRVMMGTESKKVIPEEERRVTAFHEGGHALSAILLKDQGAQPVHKATIVPRGNGIMGLVQQLPEKDKYSQSKKECLARLKVCLAGRVGEEILLGGDDVTTGATSDFQQASNMARNMVRRFGFTDSIGFVDYGGGNGKDSEWTYMSDETKQLMEREVSKLLKEAYEETKKMLLDHRKELDAIADGLLKYETLTGEDLQKILKGEPIAPRPSRIVPPASGGDAGSSSSGSRGVTIQ